ncbi:MAG: AMP-binding protein [Alphaproteobacteria bacterium]|nr:AMP-binding protein [Alphaproteobacteria bacterium]
MRAIDYFDRGVALAPERIAVRDGDTTLSFRQLRDLTFTIAAALRANGLERQEPVAIYAPNHWGVLACLLGLWRAGEKWIPVNARNALDANIQYMNYVRVSWLFYHSQYREEARQLAEQVPWIRGIVCIDRDDDGYKSFNAFLREGESRPFVEDCDAFGNLGDVVGIFPTGGTTGPAKGVNVTNLGWGTMQEMGANFWHRGVENPVCLVTAPLTHAAGPVSTACLSFGATNVVLPGFDALHVLEAIETHKVTHLYLPPTALYALLDHPHLKDFDCSSLKVFLLVGSPVSPEKLRLAVEMFGGCMCQCYGQVESPLITTWLPPEIVEAAARGDHPERLKSCGRPTYPVRVGIMDDDGNLLPDGERGEIVVRGALVSHSYFEKPEATAEARAFGWHHTGDVAYRDADGFIYIVDRKKDMIVTGGFNVFTTEVEDCVMELTSVAECAVIGVPHEKWGEAIKAVVVSARGATVTEEEIIAHCKRRLGGVKAPKSVDFWAEIPKTANNKMDKKAIRSKYWANAERNVN